MFKKEILFLIFWRFSFFFPLILEKLVQQRLFFIKFKGYLPPFKSIPWKYVSKKVKSKVIAYFAGGASV